MWPNEATDDPAPYRIRAHAGDWREILPDEPSQHRDAPTMSLFGPFGAIQSVSVEMLSSYQSALPEIAKELLELRRSMRPLLRAVINGKAMAFGSTEAKFNALLEAWRRETLLLSDQVAILTHPSYYAIIGMGHEALPFIFRDLAAGGGPWFVALNAITQENPVPEKNKNNARLMREDWLGWGRSHGYIAA
jgi:hypothetical protein